MPKPAVPIYVPAVTKFRFTHTSIMLAITMMIILIISEILRKFDDDTLFIDLASKPGGIDFDSASELGKKVVWALGIPGKTAPVTSGEFIAETVINILTERGVLNE